MSFIGNRPDSFGYSSTSYDHFSGTGSQTVYTLSRSVTANADIFVTVNNVPQDPGVAYYVTNLNTLTFTSAPSSASNNIVVVYRNFVQSGVAPGANTVSSSSISPGVIQPYHISSVANTQITGQITSTQLDVGSATGTGALKVPVGTTAQRPPITPQGYIRYNTDLNSLESANGTAWSNVGSGSTTTSGSGGITWTPTVQNTSFIAVKNTGYFVNTTSSVVTVTLPLTPTVGDTITLVDYAKKFNNNNLILYPNGNKIDANTSNVSLVYNSSSVQLVYVDNNQGWVSFGSFTASPTAAYYIDYLLVAGGGGGTGGNGAAGGGAGGYLEYLNQVVTPGISYPVTIGAGGSTSTNGSNSTFYGQTAIGGGGAPGNSGGSGAGAYGGGGSGTYNNAYGAGTSGQGNPGGSGYLNNYGDGGGGGGGANASGGNGGNNSGGAGGAGKNSAVGNGYYAGGGGGGSYSGSGGTGGLGGGGNGGSSSAGGTGPSTGGTANKGGGGGGAGANGGSAGGSGVTVVRYPGNTPRGQGGTITTSGGYVYHTFNSSGTFIS